MSKFTAEDIRDIVFAPQDAVATALATIEDRRSTVGVGVRLGVSVVDEYMLPARPGELITIIGMSSQLQERPHAVLGPGTRRT